MHRASILTLGLVLLAPACGGKDDTSDDGSSGGDGPASTGDAPTSGGGSTGGTTGASGEPMTSGSTTQATTSGETGPTSAEATGDPSGDPGGDGLSCDNYCGTIAANCTGAEAQYGGMDFCLQTCATIPPGTIDDMAGNTLGCRIYHAGAAASDAATHCVHAGPGGAGACGDNCESFCAIAGVVCPEAWPDVGACMTACMGFDPGEKFDASDVGGNTFACRLYHLTAATLDAAVHCPHIKGDSAPCM